MSDPTENPLDALGRNLSSAFDKAERSRRSRNRRRVVTVAAAIVAVSVVGWEVNNRVASNEVFTVQEAIAEVVAKSFDRPATQSAQYLYEASTLESMFSAGLTVSERTEYETRVVAKSRTERWIRLGRGGWVRTTEYQGRFLSEKDRQAAESMRDHNLRMAARAERARRKRGDRRPVPRDMLTGSFAVSSALSDAAIEPRTTVCKVPGWGTYLLGGQFSFASLPEPGEIPGTARGVVKLLTAKTRSFQPSVDRTGWLWATITLYLSSGGSQLDASQRAALVGAIGLLEGVETTGKGSDPLGRDSIGFYRVERGVKYVIYFDASTGLPIYSSGTVVNPVRSRFGKVPVGTVVERQVLNEFKYVDAPPPLTATTRRLSPIDASVCHMFRGSLGRQMKKRAMRIQQRLARRSGQ